jgi:hypothetical protein
MPKLDTIHIAVKNALTKAGWVITHDPYKIVYEEMTLYADLAAEHPIAAERQGRKIVVEIKSFLGPTWVQELKTAVGQYDIYRTFLEVVAPERDLYLAINHRVYEEFFAQKAVQLIVEKSRLALFTVDVMAEEIVTWTR